MASWSSFENAGPIYCIASGYPLTAAPHTLARQRLARLYAAPLKSRLSTIRGADYKLARWFRALVQGNTSAGVSNIAQIPDGQKRQTFGVQFKLYRNHPGVRGLAPKHVGRKEIPCKYLQSFKENR